MREMEQVGKSNEATDQEFFSHLERLISEPWDRTVRTRGPRRALWWKKAIGNSQQRRKQLARKWHGLDVIVKTANEGAAVTRAAKAHLEVQEQKKHIRRLERQAKTKFEHCTSEQLREAGLIDQSKAIKMDQQSKARRLAEARRNGRQLCPAAFTRFMEEKQGKCHPLNPRPLEVDNRRMRRRIRDAILQIAKNKAVGVNNVHIEMLQAVPELFARMLAKLWETVGETQIVPNSWLMGVLVPLHKYGPQDELANYRPLCMLSHVR